MAKNEKKEPGLRDLFKELRESIEPEVDGILSMLEGLMEEKGAFDPKHMEEYERMTRMAESVSLEEEEKREFYESHPEEKAKVLAGYRKREALFLLPGRERKASKLGGTPDGIEAQFTENGDEMELLAQIACTELPGQHPLPTQGTLYFFHNPNAMLYDDSAFRVIYSPETPQRGKKKRGVEEQSIVFSPGDSYEHEGYDSGIDDDDWMESPHWLLGAPGWPFEETLPATEGSEWLLLLRLDEDDDLGWCWSDCGILCFYIRRKDLAAGNFSNVRAEIYSG